MEHSSTSSCGLIIDTATVLLSKFRRHFTFASAPHLNMQFERGFKISKKLVQWERESLLVVHKVFGLRKMSKSWKRPSLKSHIVNRKVALAVSRRSVQIILHKFTFEPYKLQLDKQLKPKAIMNKVYENPIELKKNCMSDKAHFQLNGYVNKQNYRSWTRGNTAVFHECALHSPKVTA